MKPAHYFNYEVVHFPYGFKISIGFVIVLLSGLFVFSCIKNEHPPEISDQEFFLDENSPSGTIIGVITAVDLDENSILSYTILEGNPNSTFIIGEHTGILSVGNPTSLDYEENRSFSLKIQVSDNQADKSKISEATIKININDLNEYAPMMEDHLFEIQEFPGNDSLIGIINATDLDKEQSLIFSIESGNENECITIDSLSGEVFVADSTQFDHRINPSIKCLISVSDNHSTQPKKDYALLTIEIKEGDIRIVSISGNVQKGPFIQGSVITVSELNQKMELTGRTFNTNITDNSGSFKLENITLKSNFVQLNANGFYFNERTGNLSDAQLSIYCIADITNLEYTNINILSHIENERIKYLIHDGFEFDDAKTQAHQEVLAIFDISNDGSLLPEQMDISKAGDDNAILLAISVILQGVKSTGELSEFINRISADIKEDGVLDNQALGTELINSVNHSNMAIVRDHLETRYSEITEEYIIPDFEKYVTQFIESTIYEPSNEIIFPPVGTYGTNSLHPDTLYIKSYNNVTNDISHSLCAEIPDGRSLKVRITGETIGISMNSEINMDYIRDPYNEMVTISSVTSGFCDLRVKYLRDYDENPSENLFFEYFADGSEEPYFTKYLTVIDENNPPPDSTNLK